MSRKHGGLETFINDVWYGTSFLFVVLLPLTLVFSLVASLRRNFYRNGILSSNKIPVPVIVVGNIAVGGAGKTPVTLWLAQYFKTKGMNPAIISRGYGGEATSSTVIVNEQSDPALVGDEPVLLALRSGCPVFVDADRVRGATSAMKHGADLILSDDGLQHYRLQRDIEIAVVDGSRGFGNGWLLPAGPLREPVGRLATVDRVLVQQGTADDSRLLANDPLSDRITNFSLVGETLSNVADGSSFQLGELAGKTVHAVAGIAHPERFFKYLEQQGINVLRHPLPDHARLSDSDVRFDDDLDVVITEKDAVKCTGFAHERLWYLPVDLVFEKGADMQWLDALHDKLQSSVSQEPA